MNWRWSPPEDDRWLRSDKLAHLLGGLVWVLLLGALWRPWAAFWTGLAFWWLWEVKDAFLPWERWGWIGAEGFSWRDGVAATVGCLTALAVHLLAGTPLPN